MIFYNFNLQMLNLWIGLCRGEIGLPSIIRELGYKERWIEKDFQNRDGEVVKPELIIASDRFAHTLLFEWKSGNNINSDQLRRYSNVTIGDLIEKAGMEKKECISVDTCIVGDMACSDRLRLGITKSGVNIPLLSIEDDGISLSHLNFTNNDALNRTFSPKLLVNMEYIPVSLIPFDMNSENWQIADKVIPRIIQYMRDGCSEFSLERLATDTIPVWDSIVSYDYRGELKTRIQVIVDDASKYEFKGYFYRDNARKGIHTGVSWKIGWNPKNYKVDKRSHEYKSLLTRQKQLLDSLRSGGKRQELQMHLGI